MRRALNWLRDVCDRARGRLIDVHVATPPGSDFVRVRFWWDNVSVEIPRAQLKTWEFNKASDALPLATLSFEAAPVTSEEFSFTYDDPIRPADGGTR